MRSLLLDGRDQLDGAIQKYGSPLNLIHPKSLQSNLRSLLRVAKDRGIEFQPFFARKANKCLAFVDAALQIGCGVDLASENELEQVLSRNPSGSRLICTAAIKSEALIRRCIERQVVVAIDNEVELERCIRQGEQLGIQPAIAIRLGGFMHKGHKLHTRFGFDIEEIHDHISRWQANQLRLKILGLHFHLDGYDVGQRLSAINQCLELLTMLRLKGYQPAFLDIGGGLPVSYLESETQWLNFWEAHRKALIGITEPVTYRNHPLGLLVHQGKILGVPNVYPYFQFRKADQWLASILDSSTEGSSHTIASRIADLRLELRCEPGRSALDGGGLTAARVEFVKRHPNGDWFVGLAMNRTQCRTSSDDFLVDPLVLSAGSISEFGTGISSGYFVGAYCTESELLSLRRFSFSCGINVGDIVVFPNTAGYFMHFLESRSHQFPLAKNLVLSDCGLEFELDDIDNTLPS